MIAALLAGGEHVDDGRFCFDAEAAARVADYQLAEPRLWVVLLVEVAVMLGAAAIRFRFSGWVVEVTIEHEDVDPALIDALERHAVGMGATQQLGVAYRAALRTGVDRLSVNAIAGDGHGRRLAWSSASGPVYESCDGAPGLRVALRFAASVPEPGEVERALLLRRARVSSFPVFIDDRQISVGWRGAFGQFGANLVNAQVPVLLGEREIGRAGICEYPRNVALALLMQNGVVIEELPLANVAPRFTAAVEVELSRDLSRTRFVRGPEFDAVIAAILAAVPRVQAHSRAAAQRLQTALAPRELGEVAPVDAQADLQLLAEANPRWRLYVGGGAFAASLLAFVVIGTSGPLSVIPVALLGVAAALVLWPK